MINIVIGKTSSEPNRLSKSFSLQITLNGTLKEETSITQPVILVESSRNLSEYNYCHISTFGRYYYITDISVVRTNLWRISLKVDVLMTYKSDIRAMPVILADSKNKGDNYLSGTQWRSKVKTLTDIISFPNGLLDTGEYILITAGG